MSLAERQAKRTCHIDERKRERERESWLTGRERGRESDNQNRVLRVTPSARFVAPFVGPAAAASFRPKTKLAAAEKRW